MVIRMSAPATPGLPSGVKPAVGEDVLEADSMSQYHTSYIIMLYGQEDPFCDD
jgi:hypothetical protein